jgi:hypothetical protein
VKLSDIKLADVDKLKANRAGVSTDICWSTDHMRHVYHWLITRPESQFYKLRQLLVRVLNLSTPGSRIGFMAVMEKGEKEYWNFKYRQIRTQRLKLIASGRLRVKHLKLSVDNRVLGYEIEFVDDPKPYPIPPIYQGTVQMGHKALKISVRRTDHVTFKSDVEGKARLTNPFGRR